ncbi:MAG TPA: hypothetical protein VGR30_10905 [Candidatus Binatia bacterium]|jgi:vacuolar-type H+-ATPase subunit H|nr:hypothetical protein [Candidatus Binatia bacterium]
MVMIHDTGNMRQRKNKKKGTSLKALMQLLKEAREGEARKAEMRLTKRLTGTKEEIMERYVKLVLSARKEIKSLNEKISRLQRENINSFLDDSHGDSHAQKIYRRLAAKYHPDRNPQGAEIMTDINELWQSLVSQRR